MEYELFYEQTDGGQWVSLDLGDAHPAISYELADIADLKDRRAAWSQAIELPATPHNLRSLACAKATDVILFSAYRLRRCRLMADGLQISPAGAALYILKVDHRTGGTISVQIVSGVRDLFDTLGEEMESALKHPNWQNFKWTTDGINAQTTSLLWPLVSTRKGATSLDWRVSSAGKNAVQLFELAPAYNLMQFVQELFDVYGYDIESNLPINAPNNAFAQSLYITLSDIQAPAEATSVAILTNVYVPARQPMSTPFTISQNEKLAGSDVDSDKVRLYYYAPQSAEYEIALKVSGGYTWGGQTFTYQVSVHQNDGETKEIISNDIKLVAGVLTLTPDPVSTKMNIGEYAEVVITNPVKSNEGHSVADIQVTVQLAEGEDSPGIGSVFGVAESLGFKNYSDFIKAFLQLFCATIDVVRPKNGETRGLVRIYTLNELYHRIEQGKTLDWSDKLIYRGFSSEFAIGGYAQVNTISLTEDEDDASTDSITVNVDNRTLEGEAELFGIKFGAGRAVPFSSVNKKTAPDGVIYPVPTIPSVPTLEAKAADDGVITLKYKGTDARLIRIDNGNMKYWNLSNATGCRQFNGTTPLSLPQAEVVPLAAFNSYYGALRKMLTHARKVTAEFLLTVVDVETLDLLTPIWLDQFGAYFFVQKINNFVGDATTEVELIKL